MSKPDHAHNEGFWEALDIVVWVTVGLLFILAIEWFVGRMVRERIASGATKFLRQQAPDSSADAQT